MPNETPAQLPKKAKKPEKPNIFLRLLALLVTAALVLGAAALVIFRDRLNVDALRRWISYRNLDTSDTGQAAPFTHAGGDKLSFAYLNSGILLSSAAGAHYYSFSGEQYAEQVLTMANPVLNASDSAGVVYDAGGQSLFLFRNAEVFSNFSVEGSGNILSARVNGSGWLAVTAQQQGHKGAVTVYKDSGEPVIQISLSDTFVVDAALSPDCRTVAVVTIGQQGGVFRSKVSFYPVNSDTPSAQADLGSTVVLDLDYEDNLLWVLGEDRLMTVATGDGSTSSWSFGRSYLKGCSLGGDGFALVLLGGYRMGSADQAVTVGPDGAALSTLTLTGQVLSYSAAGSYCSLLTGGALTIYDRALTPYAALTSTGGARYTALSGDGSALLADGQRAWLYIPA